MDVPESTSFPVIQTPLKLPPEPLGAYLSVCGSDWQGCTETNVCVCGSDDPTGFKLYGRDQRNPISILKLASLSQTS